MQRNLIIKLLVLVIPLLLMLISCRKKCREEDRAKIYLDAELESYFGVFKKGNYWVYENEDKSKRDSIYVTYSERKFDLSVTPCKETETMKFTLKGKTDGFFGDNDSTCVNAEFNGVAFAKCRPGYFFIDDLSFLSFYPDTIYSGAGAVNKKTDSKILNNKLFLGPIIEIQYKTDTLYMQKNTGIIGYKKNKETYNLVNNYLQP